MRAHYLKHVPFEGLGSIRPWLLQAGYTITRTPFYESPVLPAVDEIDILIVTGGPMSVHDEVEYPWLKEEKAFIREAIERGIPTLGICLGAQLIANVLGADVYPSRQKEIGWYPIRSAKKCVAGEFCFPASVDVFHWHGETFDLPQGATLLASNDICPHQAFQVGHTVIGLQFHLEMTPESTQKIVDSCLGELVPGPTIQSEEEIGATSPVKYDKVNLLMDDLLTYMTACSI